MVFAKSIPVREGSSSSRIGCSASRVGSSTDSARLAVVLASLQ